MGRSLPSAAVHRADLQVLLVREVGEGTLRLSAEVEGFEQDEGGVTVFLGGGEERADILVGADGLRSKTRAALFGPEKPRHAGYTGSGGSWWSWRSRERSFCRGVRASSPGGGAPGLDAPT